MRLMVLMICFLLCPVPNVGWNENLRNILKTHIHSLINLSSEILETVDALNKTQFGGLFLFDQTATIVEQIPAPTQEPFKGLMYVNNETKRAPDNDNVLDNYFVAAPTPNANPKKGKKHVEDVLLNTKGNTLLNAYAQKHEGHATHAVLYTYYSPCGKCIPLILKFCKAHPKLEVALAYTEVYNFPSVEQSINNLNNLTADNLFVFKTNYCSNNKKKRSTGPTTCELNTFQGCLLHKLDHFCCFQNNSDKFEFVNSFAAECFPDYNKACSDVFMDARFSACSTSKEKLHSSFDRLVQNCSSKALSNPLQASAPNVFTGILDCPNCLQTPPKSCSLKQVSACGHRGALCTTTAGNSMCRDDHYCGLHGESYSWCYIDDEDNWDYCCLGSCKMDSQKDAMMCYTGQATDNATNTQESAMYRYCGDAGTQTVTGDNCNASHPCGTHNGTDYYWCYTQSGLGWDYCCRPDQVCGKKGQDFNWCLVGRNSSKMECNPAREAECDNKPFDEEERCPCNNNCSTQGPTSESSTVVAAMPVLVLQSLLVCLVVATRLLN